MIGIQVFVFNGYCAGSPLDTIPANGVDTYRARAESWVENPLNYPAVDTEVSRERLLWVLPTTPDWWWQDSFTRIGAFVKIYSTEGHSVWCINAVSDVGFGDGLVLQYLSGIDFDETTWDDYVDGITGIRLEDPVKFCTSIPPWVPNNSEARRRWVPVMTDFTSTIGQQLDLQGGVTSVDGTAVGMVTDRRFSEKLAPVLRTKLPVWTGTDEGGQVYEYYTLDNLTNDTTTMRVFRGDTWTTIFNGVSYDYPPSFADLVANDQFPLAAVDSTEVTEVFPMFMETEAVWLDTAEVDTEVTYSVERYINGTTRASKRRSQILFDSLPTSIGMTCSMFFIRGNMNPYENVGYVQRYEGLAIRNTFQTGMTAFEIQISAVTFTARISAGETIYPSQCFRSKTPKIDWSENFRYKIRPYLYGKQNNFEDRFRWVRIGNLAVPVVREGVANFASNDAGDIEVLRDIYGIIPGDGETAAEIWSKQIQDEEFSGQLYTLYFVGFAGTEGTQSGIVKRFLRNRDGEIINVINPPTEYSGDYGRFTIIPLDVYGSETEQRCSIYIRSKNLPKNYVSDTQIDIGDLQDFTRSISNDAAEFIHLFEAFCIEKDEDELENIAQPFWYKTKFVDDQYNARGAYISTHPVDVILQVLTSTGSGKQVTGGSFEPGWNGPWDVIPSEFSMGIPLHLVNISSFEKIFARMGPEAQMRNCFMDLAASGNIIDWLNNTVLKPWFLAIAVDENGVIIGVDLNDFTNGPSNRTISVNDYIRSGNGPLRIEQETEYVDVADSFAFKWKSPYQNWDSPLLNDQLQVNGQRARSASGVILSGRVFRKIQTSPISMDLKWSPTNSSSLSNRTTTYLEQYRRTLPKVTFEIFYDASRSPAIGELVNFALPHLPGPNGVYSKDFQNYVGKVVDSNVDFKSGQQVLQLLVLGTLEAGVDLRWNLTANVDDIDGDVLATSFLDFVPSASPAPFLFDFSVFSIGADLSVYDANWRLKTVVALNDVSGNEFTVDDSTGISVGDRLVFTSVSSTLNTLAEFIAWQNYNKRYQ